MSVSDPPKGTCRFCGHSSWKADEKGPIHPCCYYAAREGRKICAGCVNAFSTATPAKPRRRRR